MITFTVKNSRRLLDHCQHSNTVMVARQKVQFETKASIEDSNMNLNFSSSIELFVFHRLPFHNTYCALLKTFSGSKQGFEYGKWCKAKNSIREKKIQLETEISIWIFRLRLNFSYCIDFHLIMRTANDSERFLVHCKHLNMVIGAKKRIKLNTEIWIWMFSLRLKFLYCIDFHFMMPTVDEKRSFLVLCNYYHKVVGAKQKVQLKKKN